MADETEFIHSFAEFIQASPTSYHAVRTVAAVLRRAGFEELAEGAAWDDVTGSRFVVRDGAIIAWRTPDDVGPDTGVRIVGSHTDSPALKLKPDANYTSAGWSMLNVEVYGGPLPNSLLDRELGLAGRLVTRDGEQVLVATGPIARVPQLAPHLDRSAHESLSLSRQEHLMPLVGLVPDVADIEAYLCEVAGLDVKDLAFHDILTFPTQKPTIFGTHRELFASARLDNLSSVYTSLAALVDVDGGPDICLLAAFDHEEVGSNTRSGAAGPFLEDILVRIAAGLGLDADGYRALLARSSCISADAAHSVNPNYVGKHDRTNRPLINRGPVLKINANQRYATDGVGAALWLRACAAGGVESQAFVGNNDVPCGSTIGPLTATRLGIATVDVGIPLLSMHSARELCGVDDPIALARALVGYWSGA